MRNEVKRYDPINSDGTCGMCIEDADYGAYVEYADYAALEAELDKLRAELERRPMGEGLEVVAFYWLDTGYENPNRHGPYFGWPNEDALRRVDGGAMPIALCRLSDAQRAIAERDATIERLEAGIPRLQEHAHQMRQQRDRLAGLLRDAAQIIDTLKGDPVAAGEMLGDIDAALAEVSK